MQNGIRVAPDNPAPYIELAEILVAAGRYGDALQVLPEMPLTTDSLLKSEIEAICHVALGNDAAALKAAIQAQKRPRALVVLGTLAARQGDLTGAETFFRQAITADPSCSNGWLSLGMLLWGNGDHDGAYQAVRRAVTVDPLNDEAVKILRDMAERLG
jgi:cytochrome c-type biogenesis protein CcmH/NrfG